MKNDKVNKVRGGYSESWPKNPFFLIFAKCPLYDAWLICKRSRSQDFKRVGVKTSLIKLFTFSSHTEYVKRESIVIDWVKKKKNSLLLINVYDFYVLEDETSQKKFPSVCLSVCRDVRTYVDYSWGHNNFWRS